MTVGWWYGGDDADGDDAEASPRDPALSSCDLRRSGRFQTRPARSWRMNLAANRNSNLNHLLQRAATALEPPANVSPQPTSYDSLNTIQSLFLPPTALSYVFFFQLSLF